MCSPLPQDLVCHALSWLPRDWVAQGLSRGLAAAMPPSPASLAYVRSMREFTAALRAALGAAERMRTTITVRQAGTEQVMVVDTHAASVVVARLWGCRLNTGALAALAARRGISLVESVRPLRPPQPPNIVVCRRSPGGATVVANCVLVASPRAMAEAVVGLVPCAVLGRGPFAVHVAAATPDQTTP